MIWDKRMCKHEHTRINRFWVEWCMDCGTKIRRYKRAKRKDAKVIFTHNGGADWDFLGVK